MLHEEVENCLREGVLPGLLAPLSMTCSRSLRSVVASILPHSTQKCAVESRVESWSESREGGRLVKAKVEERAFLCSIE